MPSSSLETARRQKIQWIDISSEDDLRKLKKVLGSFQGIKNQLSDDLKFKVKARGYGELLNKIERFRLVFGRLQQQDSQEKNDINLRISPRNTTSHEDAHFFASEQHRLTYALIRLQGSQRMKMLGITEQHWQDPDLIKKWFRNLSKEIHPDHNKILEADLAWRNLEKVKNDLLQHAERFGKRSN